MLIEPMLACLCGGIVEIVFVGILSAIGAISKLFCDRHNRKLRERCRSTCEGCNNESE